MRIKNRVKHYILSIDQYIDRADTLDFEILDSFLYY